MDFPRIDAILADCKAHLDATGTRGTAIEHYLVSHLLVRTMGEYEQAVEAMVYKRVARTGDAHVANFASAAAAKLVRGPRIDELGNVLKLFDKACRELFIAGHSGITAPTSYDNIATNRHAIAHGSVVMMTLADFEKNYQDSKAILEQFAKCIGLAAAEIAALTW